MTRPQKSAQTDSPAAKPLRKPGRPKRPVVPAPAAPAAMSISDVMTAQLNGVKAKAASGKALANHESRILRDAWLIDMAIHLWPNLEACAADLGVSPSTVRGYADAGCPGLEPHSPIPKAPVLAWLLKRAHERGGTQHANAESIEAVELRLKTAKAVKAEGALIAEAEDRATQGVIQAMTRVRQHLTHSLPGQIYDEISRTPDRADAESAIGVLIEQALASAAHSTPAADAATTEQDTTP